ncbi:hypothetical protein LPJ68_003493 [Coemansia sp. RSA 1086]|nr:hypothetical protein LPJ68_003493 [Coemansia sp. RSA 1086]
MDLTSSYRKLVQRETSNLKSSNEKPSARKDLFPPKRIDFTQPNNAFLSEAYIIAKHLRSLHQRILEIRPAYLNLPQNTYLRGRPSRSLKLSDPERDEIDHSIKATVQRMLSQIRQLNELGESLVEDMEDDESPKQLLQRFVGALDPRKAGNKANPMHMSKRNVAAAVHSSVVWWLNAQLRNANQTHAKMQELYLRQKLERQQSRLQQPLPPKSEPQDDVADELLQSLSPQQLQQLQQENKSMENEFSNMLDSIRDTQRSVAEISALQIQLSNELSSQMQQTEQLYNEAVGAVELVEKGNESLVSAHKNQASTRKWVLFIFIMLSFVLLFLDWYD